MNYTANNGKIYINGKHVVIKGINWFGLENPEFALHGLWSVSMESVLDMLVQHKFNAIRVPFSLEFALGLDTLKCKSINISANPSLAGVTAGIMLDRLCEECAKRNILIMPDFHRFTGDGYITELWYSDEFPEERVIEAWLCLVRRCKKYGNVFAADLKNEPHGKARWDEWSLAATRIGNAILDENPNLLIFVEGVERSMDGDGTWWGGNIKDVVSMPVQLKMQNKLVYSPHVYGPDVFNQPYFSDPSFPNNLTALWDKYFGFVQKQGIGTVVIGEWGGHGKDKDGVWQETIARYFKSNQINSFYWCVNPNSGDTGGILGEDWVTPHLHKLAFIENACPDPTDNALPTPQPTPVPVPQPTPVHVPQPTLVPVPAVVNLPSTVVLDVREESTWSTNGTQYTKFGVDVINNTTAAINDVHMYIDFEKMQQMWNVVDNGNKRFTLPQWVVESKGIPPGGKHNFGFICIGKKARVELVGDTPTPAPALIPTPAPPTPQPPNIPQTPSSDQKLINDIQYFQKKWPEARYEAASIACGGDGRTFKYIVGAPIIPNKVRIVETCARLQLPSTLTQLILAYAFIETETLSASQRDVTKDPSGPNFMGTGAINYGCFNLNYSLLKDLGLTDDTLVPTNPKASVLNTDTDEAVYTLIQCIKKGVDLWGIDRYVSYLRGGVTLFNDPNDYSSDLKGGPFKATVFKCGLNRLCSMIQEDTRLYHDDQRVGVSIPWV